MTIDLSTNNIYEVISNFFLRDRGVVKKIAHFSFFSFLSYKTNAHMLVFFCRNREKFDRNQITQQFL